MVHNRSEITKTSYFSEHTKYIRAEILCMLSIYYRVFEFSDSFTAWRRPIRMRVHGASFTHRISIMSLYCTCCMRIDACVVNTVKLHRVELLVNCDLRLRFV